MWVILALSSYLKKYNWYYLSDYVIVLLLYGRNEGNMETKFIAATRKTGGEQFIYNGHSVEHFLVDYWAWAYSDLVNNVDRGKLAEFIVASALGASDGVSATWDKFDILYRGSGIEVKSSSYLQSWAQERESYIGFAVRPTVAPIANTATYDDERKRQSDVYVFCLLKHKDKLTLDALNLDQWEFYVVPTALLNELIPTQKSISLSFLQKHNVVPCDYSEIKIRVDDIVNNLSEKSDDLQVASE